MALDLILRATVLLTGAILLSLAIRRTSAGTRHLLWTGVFVALLGLPILIAAGLRLDVPVLPAASEDGPVPAGTLAAQPNWWETVSPTIELPLELTDAVISTDGPTPIADTPATIRSGQGDPVLGHVLLGIWLFGSIAALVSLFVGLGRLRGLVARAERVTDRRWLSVMRQVEVELGLQSGAALLLSDETTTPLTTGWLRPSVVLPQSAVEWSSDRLQVVLAHELIHIQRRDALRQIVSRVVVALYWFHPFTWVAARLARTSRELACDESVIRLGTRPSDYAAHLMELAKGLTPARPALGLPMVQRSHLEKRIMAILDPSQPQRNRAISAIVLISLAGLGVAAATARPVAHTSAQDGPLPQPDAPALASAVVDLPPVPPVPDVAPMLASDDRPIQLQGMQEMTCQTRGLSGRFSGTIRSGSDQPSFSGFHNGNRTIQHWVDDTRLCLRLQGEVVLTDDDLGVRAVGADSWVVLESEDDRLHRLVITEGPNGIEHAWSVDGREQPFDADAAAWRDQMFVVLQGFWEASSIRGQQSSLRGRISSARGRVSSMRGQISSHRGRVSSMNGRISSANGRVSSMRGRISSARGRVSSMNGAISSRRGRISRLRSSMRASSNEETQAALEAEIRGLEEEIAEIREEIDDYDVEARVAEIQREIDAYDVESVVDELRAEIEAYDLEEKVRAIEQEIEDYDVESRVEAIEREIVELDADRRAAEIESRLEPEVDALMRMIRGL